VNVRVLDHSEIDMQKWESCVNNSLNVCIFAHCWYLDTLSFGWEALVLGDYDAVMPYFTEGSKACLKFGVAWTGIYSKKEITPDLCRFFLEILDQRFKTIDLVFDKFFVVPESGLRGLFFSQKIHQIDTVNPPEKVQDGEQFLEVLKSRYPKEYSDRIRFREYNPKNVGALRIENFMALDRRMNVRPALKLKTLTERSVSKRFGYYMEISLDDKKIHGAILTTFCDYYIFVPFIKCKGMPDSFGQYTMLLDFIQRHFAYRPGILVLDDARLNISPDVLRMLGADTFTTYRYRADVGVSVRKLIRTKLLKRYNNTL